MAVLEVGILYNNQLIYRHSFQPVMDDKDLSKSAFLTSLQTFTSKNFGENTEEIKLNKYNINITSYNPIYSKDMEIFIFVISDKEHKLSSVIKKKLKKIVETIQGLRIIKDNPSPAEKKYIDTIISENFKDIGKK
ncbi:MAG: hypothetical protein ACW967_03370 [Candidatus Hodarchaeales archaeon]|jgi:hypothetical protein